MEQSEEIASHQSCAECEVPLRLESALQLQRLLTDISTRFVTRLPGQMDETIEEAQRLVCEALEVDRATLWQSSEDGTGMTLTHFWQKPGCVPLRRNFVSRGNLPWAHAMLDQGRSFHISRLDDLPPEAARDRDVMRLHGTRSNATFPLIADGKVIGAIAFAMITRERHWTESEISGLSLIVQILGHGISRHQAEARVEQLRGEIHRSARASVLGEIAASLAHEINQPLTTILGNAQAARRFILQGEAKPEEILAILDDIIRDDKRAGEVIRNMRAMLAGSPIVREPQAINELVTEVGTFLSKELAGAGIELKFDLGPMLPMVNLARVEIQQVLHNLILNAAQAMAETPPEHRRIVILTRASGRCVTVAVRDHGCGISLEHMDRIFEPFHTSRPKGLGMGLAICRRILEAHGGTLHAANHESGGAVFEFTLPSQT